MEQKSIQRIIQLIETATCCNVSLPLLQIKRLKQRAPEEIALKDFEKLS
jgi:hypothetical protein